MKNLNFVFLFFIIHLVQNVFCHSTSSEYTSTRHYNDGLECSNFNDSESIDKCKKERKSNITSALKDDFQSIQKHDIRNIEVKNAPWYLRAPLLPIIFATSTTLPVGKCKKQVERYLQELNNGTLWAVRMFDSSTKYPEGIMTGHTRHYGNFDECYEIETTIEDYSSKTDSEMINGKYCLVEVDYYKLNSSNDRVGPYTLDFDPNASVWEAIKEKGDYRRFKRYLLELALCIPDACNEEDIKNALDEPLKKFGIEEGLIIKTRINGQCQSKQNSPKFSTSAKIYCYFILGLFLLVGISTWYDLNVNDVKDEENKSLLVSVLLCFSAQRNFKSITDITVSHPALDTIHLFRFLLMCCAMFGHSLLQYYTNSLINSESLEHTYTSSSFILLHNGPIIVEIFFTFGGVLLAYHMLIHLDKSRKTNFIAAISIRYLRFTPSYAVVIFFVALILPHLGSGPDWNYKIGLDNSNCADNWWTNLLYINNYVNADKLCMFQSWYISVDFHLHINALFVIYLFWKMPRKIGYPFLIVIIIAGCAIPFYITYFYNVQPLLKLMPHIRDVKEDSYFNEHYVKTHERITSYFIGVLGGVIIYDHSLSPWNIKSRWVRLLILLGSVLVGVKSLNMGLKFHNPNMNPSSLEKALYVSLSRPIVALATVLVGIVQSVGDQSEFHYKLFTPHWAQPVARLTFGAYLLHGIPQAFNMGIARSARTFSMYHAFWNFVPEVIFSFLLSLILSLVVEGPLRKIEKQFITKRYGKQKFVVEENNPQLMKKSN